MLVRVAFFVAFALLGGLGAGFAHASVLALDDVVDAQLVPSSTPAMLGPISELGRNGWQCFPEQAAQARRARTAELPEPDGP